MKSLLPLALVLGWLGTSLSPAAAPFTSLHIFGDGVSSTTNGPGGSFYYGKRFTNGRVWVEVLAERQGLIFDPAHNLSYFGHYSPNLVTNVSNFIAPPDVGSALFVIWVNNADFVRYLADPKFAPYNQSNLTIWTNGLNRSLSVLAEDGTLYVVTTFRRDVATDGRRAVVAFADGIGTDLSRRDFTFNAIAWNPLTGALEDPFGG